MTSSGLTTLSVDFDIFSTCDTSALAGRLEERAAVALLDVVRVVVLAARVLVAVGEDHPLVEQPLERLLGVHQAAVEQHLVPEARVEQVQHRVLDAADVEVDRHPVALGRLRPRLALVVRIEEAQVVPARAGPLRHRVGLARAGAAVGQRHHQPVVAGARQRRLAVGGRAGTRRSAAARPAAGRSGPASRVPSASRTSGNGSPQ